MKNVLILGANGFIGQRLIARLPGGVCAIGYGKNCPQWENDSSIFVRGDFAAEKHMAEILTAYEIDTVYHLISTTVPAPGTSCAMKEMEENVIPTIRLLDAMVQTGTRRIVFASSGGTIYGESVGYPHIANDPLDPVCSYGIQKATIEHFLKLYHREHGITCRIARIANPYGVTPQSQRTQGIIPILMKEMLKKKPITLFGETVRDYIYIDDVADALVKLGDYPGEESIFLIGSGIGTSLTQLVEMIEACTGERFCEIQKRPIRSCDVQESILNVGRTKRLLNWEPKISLQEGIRITWDEISAKAARDRTVGRK